MSNILNHDVVLEHGKDLKSYINKVLDCINQSTINSSELKSEFKEKLVISSLGSYLSYLESINNDEKIIIDIQKIIDIENEVLLAYEILKSSLNEVQLELFKQTIMCIRVYGVLKLSSHISHIKEMRDFISCTEDRFHRWFYKYRTKINIETMETYEELVKETKESASKRIDSIQDEKKKDEVQLQINNIFEILDNQPDLIK